MANHHHYQKQQPPPGPPPGLPFPFPPPSFHQGSQHPHNPPPPQHAQPLPPPGAWSLPGLHQNFPQPPFAPQAAAAHSHNAQPPYPPPASWSHPPMHDWMQLMQSGAMPPFPPGLPPPFPPTHNLPTTSAATATQLPVAPPVHPTLQAMASDKEDGEVSDASDGGMASRSQRTQPAPPRSAPPPARTSARTEDTYNPDRPSAGHSSAQEPVQKPSQPTTVPHKEPVEIQQRREEAKQFVRLLSSNQIGYRALAGENLDKTLLRELYSSLNLPSEPEPIPPLTSTNPAALTAKPASPQISNTQPLPAKPTPVISTKVNAPAAASAPSPVDRKDYIARLQAARQAAKQPSGTKPGSHQQTPPTTVAAPLAAVKTPQPTITPTKKSPVTEEQKARNTEVIRQRLEQLRAKNKQSLPSRPHTSGTNTPTSQPQTSPFPGIPGLFMNAPPGSGNGVSASKSVPSSSQKASDTETSTPRGSVTPYTRPLGQSPYSHHEESMIIQVSDDESNGSDMDIDDDQAPSNPVNRQGPGSLPAFPPRPGQAETVSSNISTPGPQTPSSSARTGQMKTKEEELAAMKLTLKKKLAEQKRIREAAAAAAAVTPKTLPPTKLSAQPSTPQVASSPQTTASASLKRGQPSTSDSNGPVDRKRRRRTEIQEQLPSLDDEIANNEAEMARIAKDLERLKANNERIMQDKRRLTKELEELGIDTEGMSHAELRATKHDIERAKSPVVHDSPQIATTASQKLTNGNRPSASDVIERMTNSEDQNKAEPPAVHGQTGQFALLPGLGQATQAPKAVLPAQPPFSNTAPASESELNTREGPTDAPSVLDTRGSATPMDDDEDFYSQPPPLPSFDGQNESTIVRNPQTEAEQGDEISASLSEEGEVEMSLSSEDEEDEYEPEEIQPPQNYQDSQATIESQAPVSDSPNESAEDEGVYEPPDVDEQMADAQVDNTTAGADDGSYQVEAGDDAMDLASSSSEDSDESDSDSEQESSPEPEIDPAHATDRVQQSANAADDLAPELQSAPTFELAPVEPIAEAVPVPDTAVKPAGFVPYESPLRMFKSYRYHEKYSQDVTGGFLSLTFSHQIDPEQPLCSYESAGGSCNDPECRHQHFRTMGITGEKLLVQLGTANPGKTPDEKQQWNDGLRSVLKELRQKNIKDPNGIAQEIAKYRRQFLDDDTRVVNL